MLLLSTSQVKILQTTEEFFRNYGRKSRRLYLYIICASIWKGKKSILMSTLNECIIKFMKSNNQLQISQYCSGVKFGLSEKHTKFEKIFLMVLTNQLIYLVNVKTMGKIFSNYVCFSKSPNFKRVFIKWNK